MLLQKKFPLIVKLCFEKKKETERQILGDLLQFERNTCSYLNQKGGGGGSGGQNRTSYNGGMS